jgi:hypothetical protein
MSVYVCVCVCVCVRARARVGDDGVGGEGHVVGRELARRIFFSNIFFSI